jgi:predicted MPP superfamily phosphohydrolase
MHRRLLPPPTPLTPQAEPAVDLGSLWEVLPPHLQSIEPQPDLPLGREEMDAPHETTRRRRRLFDPVQGWFRRLERSANLFLSYHLLPRVPFIDRPYAVQLDHCLTVSEADIPLAGLPATLDGLRVMLITDIHTGPFISEQALLRTFRRLLELQPDIILLGGDLTTSHVADFTSCSQAFAELEAPLGVFAVMGNHDHYTEDPARLAQAIEKCGIRLLDNQAVALDRGGERLVLAGIDDLNAGQPDLDAALAQAAALRGDTTHSEAPVVLLSHNPDVFFEASSKGAALVLSGHTHGGQIRLPGFPVLVRMSRYHLDQGRYTASGAELIVSRGLGASGLPLRIGCSPEAGLFRLRTPDSPA